MCVPTGSQWSLNFNTLIICSSSVAATSSRCCSYPAFRHSRLVNRGWHTLFTGGPYDSCLSVPLNNSEAAEIALARK
jgi:hypothetical protein